MKQRLLENLHVPLWLLKDLCWAMVWRPLGLLMIVPTLSLAAYLVWMQRRKPEDFWPNVAILCWISANSVWMLDEFYTLGIRAYCLVFFGLGFLAIGWWLMRYFPRLWKARGE